jgi:AAA15 family ATPase/GTPase
MFIEFQVANFRSFRDLQKFSMRASPKRPNDHGLDETNVFVEGGFRSLRTKAIYGSNASGKSNFIKAIGAFNQMVNRSVIDEDVTRRIWSERFQLINDWDDQPIFFQYVFSKNGETFRYGFEILKSSVNCEWLFQTRDEQKEEELFFRNKSELKVKSDHLQGSLEEFKNSVVSRSNELYRQDSLFITAAALAGNRLAGLIRNEIRETWVINGLYRSNIESGLAFQILDSGTDQEKDALKKWLQAADTGIEDIELKDIPHSGGTKEKDVFSVHPIFDENGNRVAQLSASFEEWESSGSIKLLSLGAVVLDALRHGRILVLDELEARLHPNLTLKIVSLFNNQATNPKNAQFIFATHDTGLLRRADLRRDQISLVNKDRYGISELSTLIEFKGVRKDSSYEKEYLNGTYSAVPFLDALDHIQMQNTGK